MTMLFIRITIVFMLSCGIPALTPVMAGSKPEKKTNKPSYQFFSQSTTSDNWTSDFVDTETTIYFSGYSGNSKDRREAEAKALQDAKSRISSYILETIQGNYSEAFRYKTEKGHITQDTEIITAFSQSYTQNILQGIKPINSYPVRNPDGSMDVQIIVPVAVADISRKHAEIDRQIAALSRYYSLEIQSKDASIMSTLLKYERIISMLDPIECALVEFLGLDEPVNLYKYLVLQTGKLYEKVEFEPDTQKYFILGKWVANVEYNSAIYTYDIKFFTDGRCTVKVRNNNIEQETTGNWSLEKLFDSSKFKLDAIFNDVTIPYQQSIQWRSIVAYGKDGKTFNILGKVASDSPQIRFTFFRHLF